MGSNGVWCAKYLAFDTYGIGDKDALMQEQVSAQSQKPWERERERERERS